MDHLKQRNETRNTKHVNFVPKNVQRAVNQSYSEKSKNSHFYFLLTPVHLISTPATGPCLKLIPTHELDIARTKTS